MFDFQCNASVISSVTLTLGNCVGAAKDKLVSVDEGIDAVKEKIADVSSVSPLSEQINFHPDCFPGCCRGYDLGSVFELPGNESKRGTN